MNENRAKLRVLQVVLGLDTGGLEMMVISLANRLNKKGYFSDICSLNDGGDLLDEANRLGLRVWSLGRQDGPVDWRLVKRLHSLLKSEAYDVIHTHNFGPNLYGAPVAKFSRLKGTIYTQHSVMMFPCSRKTLFALKSLSLFTDSWVTVSDSVRADLIKYTRLPEDKFTTIINGIDTDKFTPVKSIALREDLDVARYDTVIGNVARLSTEKDHAALLNAFKMLLERGYNTCLVIAGDGSERARLETLIQTLGISEHVRLLGARRDIGDVLGTFDIFANSSKTEGIPLTLLEAMACGLPIVSTAVGGVPEIVTDGVTGRLTPARNVKALSDAIADLLDAPERAREMGSVARDHVVERYDLEAMTENYIREYQRIVA